MPNTERSWSFAPASIRWNCRPLLGGRHFVVMSERRSGVREYSDDRARRIMFFIVWDWVLRA